jgi:hypothetical protein
MSTYLGASAEPVLSFPYLFLLSSIYLWVPLAAPSLCPIEGVRPGFFAPDSGSSWQAAPWSPRWLIGLPSTPKPSPAKGISKPESPPVCAASKTQRGAGPFGILLPSRWNQIGFAASGPLATAEERVAAAGQTGEGHGAGGGLGDGGCETKASGFKWTNCQLCTTSRRGGPRIAAKTTSSNAANST